MSPSFFKRLFLIALSLSFSFSLSLPAHAAALTFTLTVPSAYLRSAPAQGAPRIFSLFKGQSLGVVGRNADATWLKLEFSGEAWVRAAYGQVQGGEVSTLPVLAPVEAQVVLPAAAPAAAPAASGSSARPAQTVAALQATLTAKSAFVRAGPARSYPALASVFQGQTYTARARSTDGNWLQIVVPGGPQEGWISAGAAKLNGSVFSLAESSSVAAPAAAAGAAAAPVSAPLPSGAAGGFELGGQVQGYDHLDLMRSTGMTWVKRQIWWSPGAQADGGLIAEAHARGFKILIALVGSAGDLAGGANYADYAAFAGQVAAQGADAIEVWNEPNLDRSWPRGEIDPAKYTNLLRQAYAQIKARNPGTLVISAAPSPTGAEGAFGLDRVWNDDRYVRGLVQAGAANYLDCVGIHYNEGIISPRLASGDPRDGHYTRYYPGMVSLYYNAFGGRKQLCFTELGYLTPEGYGPLPASFGWAGNTTVAQQALWLSEAVSLARGSGLVRLLVVWNFDFTVYDNDPQGGFAMLRPGGGCPACETVRAAMGGR